MKRAIMDSNLCHANTSTPTPAIAWLQLSDDERLALVRNALEMKMPTTNDVLVVTAAKQDGQVIAKLLKPVPADKRGTLLLDIEALLKESIDPGLVVWLESLGDRSSLRNLRGIEIKA